MSMYQNVVHVSICLPIWNPVMLIVSKLHICNLLGPILAWYYFYIFHVVSLVSNSMLKLLYGAQGIGN